ncbi:hypothetical protein B0T11DRAFT_281752 [Plectosphaerella cucumerina]|uniref:Uncharacterized protein n=1 Tax=Plectosphaerella cucumerina TaxID=40658 RepID=A0A8K0THS8_9PEZI|nr:hypothetical protein B0T11DRAFT_281752 [Plectosphaerella cucumerina]
MLHWKVWPQTLQESEPIPSFLSTTGLTASSWLQKRHGNKSGRGSRFLGPWGLLELFLLPIVAVGLGWSVE